MIIARNLNDKIKNQTTTAERNGVNKDGKTSESCIVLPCATVFFCFQFSWLLQVAMYSFVVKKNPKILLPAAKGCPLPENATALYNDTSKTIKISMRSIFQHTVWVATLHRMILLLRLTRKQKCVKTKLARNIN